MFFNLKMILLHFFSIFINDNLQSENRCMHMRFMRTRIMFRFFFFDMVMFLSVVDVVCDFVSERLVLVYYLGAFHMHTFNVRIRTHMPQQRLRR